MHFWIDKLKCFGSETRLVDCYHLNYGQNTCDEKKCLFLNCTLYETYDIKREGGLI